MKLAKVIYSAEGVWHLVCPSGSIRRPPCGTIVQYKQSVDGGYEVYFPGVQGYAPMGGYGFSIYFEGIDSETS